MDMYVWIYVVSQVKKECDNTQVECQRVTTTKHISLSCHCPFLSSSTFIISVCFFLTLNFNNRTVFSDHL